VGGVDRTDDALGVDHVDDAAPAGPACVMLKFADFVSRKCLCGFCGKAIKRRSSRNDPAYCSYQCGGDGQPDKVRIALHVSPGASPN
jgi:hypothetical protein